MNRWEHILDQKPRDLADYVLDQIADALAKDVREFPPPGIEWIDETTRDRYAQVLARQSKPPLAWLANWPGRRCCARTS
jgi:hypothetical protein